MSEFGDSIFSFRTPCYTQHHCYDDTFIGWCGRELELGSGVICTSTVPSDRTKVLEQKLLDELPNPNLVNFSSYLSKTFRFLTPSEIEFLKIQFKRATFHKLVNSFITQGDAGYGKWAGRDFPMLFVLNLIGQTRNLTLRELKTPGRDIETFDGWYRRCALPSGIITMGQPLMITHPMPGKPGEFFITDRVEFMRVVNNVGYCCFHRVNLDTHDSEYIRNLTKEALEYAFHETHGYDIPTPPEIADQAKRKILYVGKGVISLSDIIGVTRFSEAIGDYAGHYRLGVDVHYRLGATIRLVISKEEGVDFIHQYLINQIGK